MAGLQCGDAVAVVVGFLVLCTTRRSREGGLVVGAPTGQWERKPEVAIDRPIFVQYNRKYGLLLLGECGPSSALRFGSIQVRAACMHAAHARLLLFLLSTFGGYPLRGQGSDSLWGKTMSGFLLEWSSRSQQTSLQ